MERYIKMTGGKMRMILCLLVWMWSELLVTAFWI